MTQPINLRCYTRKTFAVRYVGNPNASRWRNR
jgi:hypothetical protein